MRVMGCATKVAAGLVLIFGLTFIYRAMQYQSPVPVYLSCPDCDAAGIPINIFKSVKSAEVACRIGKNDDHAATLLESVDLRVRVKTAYCTGWIAKDLVESSP